MQRFVYALLLLAAPALYAQHPCDVRPGSDTLDFGTVSAQTTVQRSVWLKNHSTGAISVRGISIPAISDSDSGFTNNMFWYQPPAAGEVSPGDSLELVFYFASMHNLAFRAPAFIQVRCGYSEFTVGLQLKGSVVYSDAFQEISGGLYGNALRKQLNSYTAPHTVLSYKDARTKMFEELDRRNDSIECVYTGRKIAHTSGIPDINTTKFNTEHTWPQSCGSDNEPARSDIFHLYPTDEAANSRRGNAPFGDVETPCWSVGGSKSENCTGDRNDWFEARDEHKGNVARSIFYYAVTYGNRNCDLSGNVYPFLGPKQEEFLRLWHARDSADARERQRNTGIAAIQGKLNPFISHPEFAERIYRFSDTSDFPQLALPQLSDSVIYVDTRSSDTVTFYSYVTQKGSAAVQVSSHEYSSDGTAVFESSFDNRLLRQGDLHRIRHRLTAKEKNFAAVVRVIFTDPAISPLSFRVQGVTEPTDIAELLEPKGWLGQNFPNPVEDRTTIKIQIPSGAGRTSAALKFYTSEGKEIWDASTRLHWENDTEGELRIHRSELQQFGTILFYRLTMPGAQMTRSLILQ